MITIKYGKQFEINRINSTISNLDWYKKNGYIPLIPDLSKENISIEEFVEREFKSEDYDKVKIELTKKYNSVQEEFKQKVRDKLGMEIPEEIIVFLTKYGVGGSYLLPNKVIINIAGNQINKPLLDVLKHEIVHLLVENQVIEKGLSHREKEELVNSFFKD